MDPWILQRELLRLSGIHYGKNCFFFCHMRTKKAQISAYVVCCLDSIIHIVSISEISSLYLASLAAQAGLCLTWSQSLKTLFLVTRLK